MPRWTASPTGPSIASPPSVTWGATTLTSRLPVTRGEIDDEPQAGRHPDLPLGRGARLLRPVRGLLRHTPGRGTTAGRAIAVRGAGGRRGTRHHRDLGRAQGGPQLHPGRLPAARRPRRAR